MIWKELTCIFYCWLLRCRLLPGLPRAGRAARLHVCTGVSPVLPPDPCIAGRLALSPTPAPAAKPVPSSQRSSWQWGLCPQSWVFRLLKGFIFPRFPFGLSFPCHFQHIIFWAVKRLSAHLQSKKCLLKKNFNKKKYILKLHRKVKLLSRVWLSETLSTVACQAPPSKGFSRQEYWRGLPFPLQGIFPTQGSNPGLPHCRQTLNHLSHQGSPKTPHKTLSFCKNQQDGWCQTLRGDQLSATVWEVLWCGRTISAMRFFFFFNFQLEDDCFPMCVRCCCTTVWISYSYT